MDVQFLWTCIFRRSCSRGRSRCLMPPGCLLVNTDQSDNHLLPLDANMTKFRQSFTSIFYLNRVRSFWGSRWRPTTPSKSPQPDQHSWSTRRRKVPEIEILWKMRRKREGTSVVIVASVGLATVSHSATAISWPIPHIPTPRWILRRADFGFTSYPFS